jgi:hypothetical protein
MTPFEQAEYNIKKLAENLSFTELVDATIKETAHLSEEDSDAIWKAIFVMLEASGRLDDNN